MSVTIRTGLAAVLLAGALADGAEGGAEVLIPEQAVILGSLKAGHPRVLASDAGFVRLRERVAAEDVLRGWREKLEEDAAKILKEGPSKYEIPDGKRLLATSRRVMHRVSTLALLYRLEPREALLERTWTELSAAAAFKDWNPSHFLDTAEMTAAFAIGYDWLYDAWSAERREALAAAMLKHGLGPGLASYRKEERYGWWVGCNHNWNQVCNGGLILGALALADVYPDECAEIVKSGCESLKRAMAEFAPDGAWSEGPGYWNYATAYNVFLLAGLESALGTDFGFSGYEGFAETGTFPIHMTGPLGKSFNFADAGDGMPRAPQLFWFATAFDRPLYSWYQRRAARPEAFDLLWYPEGGADADPADFSPDSYFRGAEVATFRSAWGDPKAVFTGLKVGSNRVNHSNLDLGSFVLDALGHRWILDLGADNYNLPGYFGRERWTYYRMRAEGHNTLVVNPGAEADQDPAAMARIVRYQSRPGHSFAIADLTPAYKGKATSVSRGLALLGRHSVLVQDEVSAASASEVWSFLHTGAEVELSADGRSATLRLGDERLRADLLAPVSGRFDVMDAKPLPSSPDPKGQRDNKGVRKLVLHASGVTEYRSAVLLTPMVDTGEPIAVPTVVPLADW